MNLKVETYSGAKLHEQPRRFYWQGKWQEVKEVLDRWQTPEYLRFRVRADNGREYVLRWQPETDVWELSAV
jgi:hypothetical protein